jgi:hypothetical protein
MRKIVLFGRGSGPRSIFVSTAVIRNFHWMCPCTMLFLFGRRCGDSKGIRLMIHDRRILTYIVTAGHSRPEDMLAAIYVFAVEAIFIGIWGFPDCREGIYAISFSCCLSVLLLHQSLITILKSSFAHIWRPSARSPRQISESRTEDVSLDIRPRRVG